MFLIHKSTVILDITSEAKLPKSTAFEIEFPFSKLVGVATDTVQSSPEFLLVGLGIPDSMQKI